MAGDERWNYGNMDMYLPQNPPSSGAISQNYNQQTEPLPHRTDGEPPVTQNGQTSHEDSAFYLLKDMPGIPRPGGPHHVSPGAQAAVDITGSVNLIQHHGLEHSFHKFCGKKVKEPLSNFLPNLPGFIDTPGLQDGSSLRSLIEKPPIVGKELYQLSGPQLQGFRLHPGPIPEQYRLLHQQPPAKKKHKNKKHKREHSKTSEGMSVQDSSQSHTDVGASSTTSGEKSEKKTKKQKKHEDSEKKEKKKKKDKKKKKTGST